MIEKVTAYKFGDNVFANPEDAIQAALVPLFDGLDDGTSHKNAEAAAAIVVSNAKRITEILTAIPTPPKPRKARSDKGKPRKTQLDKIPQL